MNSELIIKHIREINQKLDRSKDDLNARASIVTKNAAKIEAKVHNGSLDPKSAIEYIYKSAFSTVDTGTTIVRLFLEYNIDFHNLTKEAPSVAKSYRIATQFMVEPVEKTLNAVNGCLLTFNEFIQKSKATPDEKSLTKHNYDQVKHDIANLISLKKGLPLR